jgi:hypothetical protein
VVVVYQRMPAAVWASTATRSIRSRVDCCSWPRPSSGGSSEGGGSVDSLPAGPPSEPTTTAGSCNAHPGAARSVSPVLEDRVSHPPPAGAASAFAGGGGGGDTFFQCSTRTQQCGRTKNTRLSPPPLHFPPRRPARRRDECVLVSSDRPEAP